QLANLQTRQLAGDRLELAAVIGRRVRLHVEHVRVRRPTAQPDADHVLGPRRRALRARGLRLQHVQERHAAQRHAADAQEIATMVAEETVADGHGSFPLWFGDLWHGTPTTATPE